jgi:hypothetical protein
MTYVLKQTFCEIITFSSTLDLFIRDGAMYFFIIFGANLLNTLIYFVSHSKLPCTCPTLFTYYFTFSACNY